MALGPGQEKFTSFRIKIKRKGGKASLWKSAQSSSERESAPPLKRPRESDKKSREWAVTSGLQLPGVRGTIQGFKKEILFEYDLVKKK